MKKERFDQFKQTILEKKAQVSAFIYKIWFRASLLLLVAYIFSQKDFSFYINMNAADQQPATGALATSLPSAQQELSGIAAEIQGLYKSFEKGKEPKKKVMTASERKAAEKQLSYVDRFADVARSEMQKYGIPASITLAQGILESQSGESRLAKKSNNHFGIKCFSKKCGKGHCSNFEDDHHKDFFRNYESAWASYRDHSKLLTSKHYRHLQKLGRSDYRGWAEGLEKAGYATAKNYGDKLVRLIENLGLDAFDEP